MTEECHLCGAEAEMTLGEGAVCGDCYDTFASDGENSETEPDYRDANPTPDADESRSSDVDRRDDTADDREGWAAADFTDPESGVWPPELLEREQWMGHVEKKPFAPWGDRDHPEADPDEDARWKWGITDQYVDGDTIEMAEVDDRLDGRAFLQQFDDPYAYVDGDDVRDPETGDVHPAFVAVLERLGVTYADVSQSGAGVHAMYRGELPDGVKEASWQLDDEPWGENDDLPSIELYAGKRVCVATGEHVPGTPTEIREWDDDALEDVLDENDQLATRPDPPEREEFDLEAHEPTATEADETTDDIRDVLAALDRLDARRVADKTIVQRWNDDASTSDGARAFWPTWGSLSDNGTANYVNEDIWHDTGDVGGYGTPVVMALIDAGEMSPRNASPREARGELWWKGVDHLRNLGFSIPEYQPAENESEPVAVLPNSPKARALSAGWDWRQDDRDDGGLSKEDVQQRTQGAIEDALGSGDQVLIEALPTTGKSRGTIEAVVESGQPVTILTGRGRKEQYEQFREWADMHDLDVYTLPSAKRDCDTANGEHGEDWAERFDDWYRRGATPQDIHANAEYELGRPLPCQEYEGQECPYTSKWRFDPDDYDVLLGHYTHAHKRKVVQGRTVVFDEFPGEAYETPLGHRLSGAVTHYLKSTPELPFDDYTDLVENRTDPERRADALAYFEDEELERDFEQVFTSESGHAAAPLAAYTVLAGSANDLGNGWERADLEDGRLGLFDRENGHVYLLQPPQLPYTSGLVALDGTPTVEMWEIALGERLNHRQVLSLEERKEYVTEGLNHSYVVTTPAVKPYNSDDHVAVQQDAALLETIEEQHGEKPGVVTTATAERVYENAEEFAPLDHVDESKHFGNILGSNEFREKRVGAVVGSNHFGDRYIEKWGAYAGESVERGEERGRGLTYGEFGDRVLTHMREHDTLQAVMRFGRDGNGAVVYVHTNTLPDWVPVEGEGRVLNTWSDGMRQVLEAAGDLDEWSTAEIAAHPAVEIGERQVREHLNTLAERGVVDREVDGTGYVWRDDGLHRVSDAGEVELDTVEDEEELAEVARKSTYTWEFRRTPGDDTDDGLAPGDPPGSTSGETARATETDGPPPG